MSDWFTTYGYAEIFHELVVGAYPLDSDDVELLARMGITHVLNLVQDSEYESDPAGRATVEQALREHGIAETRLPMVDFGHLPFDELERAATTVAGWMAERPLFGVPEGERPARIYVHCRAGWQRSAAVAAGAIALNRGIGIDEALRDVQARKPTADPLPHQRRDLADWFQRR